MSGIDKSILEALILMSKDIFNGVNYMEFVKRGDDVMYGATELINKKYAMKIHDNANYRLRLTKKGEDYLNKILKFSKKKF